MKPIETHHCFEGTLSIYEHQSDALNCDMRFSVYMPPQSKGTSVPFVTFLSGLTCTHDNFTTKAGAYKYASELGVAIIAPDTSPRGDDVPDDEGSYDFGKGAGFYINATKEPWARHYNMERYIAHELTQLVCNELPLDSEKQGICGHSMGGHGALTLYLKYPDLYRSCSAFAPIVAPSQVPWGQKAFAGYLGNDQAQWLKHDATALMGELKDRASFAEILIDQGAGDSFLEEQLKPNLFQEACAKAHQNLTLRMQEGYDHSYFFIQTFIEDHLRHHAQILR